MNPDIAKEWAAELRSGKYKQVRGKLSADDGYCCLGVLCEMAVEAGIISKPISVDFLNREVMEYDYCTNYLPKSVQDWAGMASNHGEIKVNPTQIISLANMNDQSEPFEAIAKTIEEHMEKL
jgi:hypothetical protein